MLFTAVLTLNSTKLRKRETCQELRFVEGKSKKSLLEPNFQSNDSISQSQHMQVPEPSNLLQQHLWCISLYN